MIEVTTKDIKILRDRSGAGMMDCKKALIECEGNMEDAVDWLRKKGLAAAAKKSGRVAAEGAVALYTNGKHATLIEVNAETDFVARNELFQSYARTVAQLACEHCCDLDTLKSLQYPESGRTVEEELANLIAVIGENMELRRLQHICSESGVLSDYIHNKTADNLGKIGVVVAFNAAHACDKLKVLGKQIAMHIAATSPQCVSIEDMDPAVLEREKAILRETAQASGKPNDVIEKMVEGRVRKFYEEVVLMEQVFVVDGEKKIKEVLLDASKECNCQVTISQFVKFVLGEGVEKQEVDFAAEVAAQLS